MIVDKETTDQTRISISIDFPLYFFINILIFSLPCDLIQVGYSDALGNDRSDFENEILKTNLDVNGNPIGKTDKTKVSFFHVFYYRLLLQLLPKKKSWVRNPKKRLPLVQESSSLISSRLW